MHAQLRYLAQAAEAVAVADKEALADFGQLLGKADALSAIAARLAADLDADNSAPEQLNSASAGFRGFASDLQDDIDAFVAAHAIVVSRRAENLKHDLVKSFGIAGSAHRIQAAKRAQTYIQDEDHT